jgi:uncharacterized sulfatase
MKFLLLIPYLTSFLFAAEFDFKLKPIQLSSNSYYFYGKEEYFSPENEGDIANSSFIITDNSVIVIDTGSSVLYAEQMKKEIEKITNKPIRYVINTHQHPDHFLGNNAFKDAKIYASKFTANEISQNGELYIENLAQLLRTATNTTEIKAPNQILKSTELVLDSYKLNILFLDGHTKSDIVIYDGNTKILYPSDLVFNNRALATPHADMAKWVSALKKLEKINYNIAVPGHGVAFSSKEPIKENIEYLQFVDNTLIDGAKKGLNVFEILNQDAPNKINKFSVFKAEFERSVINMFPSYENKFTSK